MSAHLEELEQGISMSFEKENNLIQNRALEDEEREKKG